MNDCMSGSLEMLAPIARFCQDKSVSEIFINRPGEIWVERGESVKRYDIIDLTEVYLHRLFQLIASENSHTISAQNPLFSGKLKDGSHVQLCLPPAAQYPVMSLCPKVLHHMTIQDCGKLKMFSEIKLCDQSNTNSSVQVEELKHLASTGAWQLLLKAAILQKKNIVISGGTFSGKTTFLNACLAEIALEERLLILENTKGVKAPQVNQVSLAVCNGQQGEANVSMQDLVRCALRLQPDRIIMDEIQGQEIIDFLYACSTGHEGSIITIHANSPDLALMRMTKMYQLNTVSSMNKKDILRELKSVIDVVIQLSRTPNGRKISEIYLV